MFVLVESRRLKIEAHVKLQARLEKSRRSREVRDVVWRPGSRRIPIHHNGTFWFGSVTPNDEDITPRYWNPFGEYREVGGLQIAVEVNVPTRSNSKRVSGFLALESASGSLFLMHDGGVGGGRKGVGKIEFLEWSDSELVPVVDSLGNTRLGIVVAAIDSANTAVDIARFVQKAIEFKDAAKRGDTATPQARAAQRRYGDYFDEFSGKKRRGRLKEIEYISRHGDIVRALRDWRLQKLKARERVFKDAYVDLGVEMNGVTREIYEVKTSCDRQALYTAIGQVVVHDDAANGNCKRLLVLPKNDVIPADQRRAFDRSGISLVRLTFRGDEVRLFEL